MKFLDRLCCHLKILVSRRQGNIFLKRIILSLIIILLLGTNAMAATAKLEIYNPSIEDQQSAALQWKLAVGKNTEDLLLLPNGNLLFTAASKQAAITPLGKVVWEAKCSSGNFGKAIIDPYGSIYAASSASIQETLPNGMKGWSFSSFPAVKGGKSPLLSPGPNQLLYFPLPDALYALDTRGHYAWSLFPWDSAETYSTKSSNKREFLACAGDELAFYVVFGNKAAYRLAAIDRQGKFLWSYWLGDISKVYLVADGKGQLYASVSYNKSSNSQNKTKSKLLPGKLFCFKYDSNRPVWEQSLKIEKELSAPVLNAELIYVNANSEIYAYRVSNGSVLWNNRLYKLESPVAISPINGRIYAGSSEGSLYALNPSGRMIWERKLDGSIERAPFITKDGTMYVITNKGSLYKLQDKFKDA